MATTTIDQLAEAIQRLAALAQQPAQPQSSVELSQTAKGATQATVKAYAASADEAAATAQRLYDTITGKYAPKVEP